MKSPITGKEMKLIHEERQMTFRKEEFTYIHHAFHDEDIDELFTTTQLDEINMLQVYNQYRERFNIPFPEQIKKVREKYEVSAKKMSEILGFGVNGYRNYENGEMPSVSNARLIHNAKNPKVFLDSVKSCNSLSENDENKIIKKIEKLIEEERKYRTENRIVDYLLGEELANKFTGYRQPNLERFIEMIVFFAERLQPYKTKMNKLLFYADFLNYKRSCFSISGIQYRAIQMGPVPYKYESIYEYVVEKAFVDADYREYKNVVGTKFISAKEHQFNKELFSENELNVLEEVVKTFSDKNSNEISEISHNELAWMDNMEKKEIIDYNVAFQLTQI